VTVAAIIAREGRYLLVEEETQEGLRLNNPAGHLELGESLVEAVAREALEETGRRFVPRALVGAYLSRFRRPSPVARTGAEDVTFLRFAFDGEVGEPEAGRALDREIVRVVWMTPDEVRASAERHRSPLVLACLEDHLAGRRWPLALLTAHPSLYAPPTAATPPPPRRRAGTRPARRS